MIDFHTHPVLVQEFVAKYQNYERMARRVFNIGNNFQPLEMFLLQMDVAGIERAVLLPIDCQRARKDAVSSNQQVAELCTRSKRFIGFASVDPLKEGAARELEHAVKKMGLKGLKLDPSLHDFDAAHRKVFPFYEAAAALRIPLLIHTGMSWALETPLARGHPLILEPPIRQVRAARQPHPDAGKAELPILLVPYFPLRPKQ
jgi:predicted TIM-barrel fold metal-dependent hydrolase